jgi:lipid-A-disaccharide synthase
VGYDRDEYVAGRDKKYKVKIFISAGEKSGDLHAGGLVSGIRELIEGRKLNISGLGGDNLKAEGVELLYHVNQLTTSGITDVLRKYGFFRKVLKAAVSHIEENSPDAVVLVDFPGFNLKLAESIRKFYRGKTIYYISPQVWAWHASRIKKIKRYIDEMLVVFPFEVDFYRRVGITAVYVGHPLVRRIREFLKQNQDLGPPPARRGISDLVRENKVITILPGTRHEEIKNHLPVLIETARKLREELGAEIFFHAASDSISELMNACIKDKGATPEPGLATSSLVVRISRENVYKQIFNSDLVFTKAGTATMECALLGVPMIIFYRTSPLNYHLIKPMVKVKNMGMINILLGMNAVREFIQREFTAKNLVMEAKKIFGDEKYRDEMKKNLAKTWNTLGDKDASANAARIIVNSLIVNR